MIPLYNGVVMFPDRKQRAALHGLLTRVLGVERRVRDAWRWKAKKGQEGGEQKDQEGDKQSWTSRWEYSSTESRKNREKPSHAFLICEREDPDRAVDIAKVGVALWRIRMWEGIGWGREHELAEVRNEQGGQDGKWVTPKRNRDTL